MGQNDVAAVEFIDGHRVLECLGSGGMGSVFRVAPPHGGRPLALKWMGRPGSVDRIEELRFAREFKIAAGIVHPNVVQVFSYGKWEGVPYYTMELIEGHPIDRYMVSLTAEGSSDARWWTHLGPIIDQVLDGLGAIHRQHILHRDLKPANILVDVAHHVKIVDFGVSRRSSGGLRLTNPGTLVGTPRYLSPEVIHGREVDRRSDLYALGILLYELTTQMKPFQSDNQISLILEILSEPVRPPTQYNAAIPPAVESIIMRLLEKEPANRYFSAEDVRLEWAAAFPATSWAEVARARLADIPAQAQTIESRFVGRQTELTHLKKKLYHLEAGQGSVVMLMADAGMGKTRLLMETAEAATTARHRVIWGRCQEDESVPFQAFLPLLRHLMESQQDPQVSHLLHRLLPRRSTSSTGHLRDSAQDRFRLLESAARLVRAGSEPYGLVLLLEDLQWCDAPGLELLAYLVNQVVAPETTTGARVQILGTLRADNLAESPALQSLVETVRRTRGGLVLTLGPLSLDETAQMIRSTLGDMEVPDDLAASVHQEAEGNPLFVGEMVKGVLSNGRLVRRDAGFAWGESHTDDPSVPITVLDVVQRRLRALGEDEQRLLAYAAVAGVEFSLDLMAAALGKTEAWTLERIDPLLAQHLLVERARGKGTLFAFYHKKFQDLILADLPSEVRQAIHRDFGSALEKEGGSVYSLAWHYVQAGIEEKALTFLGRAAEEAARAYSYHQAAEYYEELRRRSKTHRFGYGERIGDLRDLAGEHAAAQQIFAQLSETATDPLGRGRLCRKQATACYLQGDYPQALRFLRQALSELGANLPEGMGTYVKALEDLLRSAVPNLVSVPFAQDPERAREIGRVALGIAHTIYFLSRTPELDLLMADCVFLQTQVAHVLDEPLEHAQANLLQAYLCIGLTRPMLPQALKLIRRAVDLARGEDDTPLSASLRYEAGYTAYMIDQPELSLGVIAEGFETSRRIADLDGMCSSLCIRATLRGWLGQLRECIEECEAACRTGEIIGAAGVMTSAAFVAGRACIWQGKIEEGRRWMERAESLLSGRQDRFNELWVLNGKGLLAQVAGDYDEAERCFSEALGDHLGKHTGIWHKMDPGAELAETYLLMAQDASQRGAVLKKLDGLLHRLQPQTRGLSMWRAVVTRIQGDVSVLRGNPEGALRLYERSASVLRDRGYRTQLLRTLVSWGRTLETQSRGRGRSVLTQALHVAVEMPATGPAATIRAILEGQARTLEKPD